MTTYKQVMVGALKENKEGERQREKAMSGMYPPQFVFGIPNPNTLERVLA